MAPFSIPAPCVVPLRTPLFGGPRIIDTQTKIELVCDTNLPYEIYYTLDGTKPQPYAGIIQGSKLYMYKSPFSLPFGKNTVKAIALSSHIHSMRSSVVTKYFEVAKADNETEKDCKNPGRKRTPKKKKGSKFLGTSNEPNSSEEKNEFMLDKNINNYCRDDRAEDFPPDLEFFPGDDVSESLSEVTSLASVSNKTEDLNEAQFEIEKAFMTTPSPPLTDSEQTSQEKDGTDDLNNKYVPEEEDNSFKVEEKVAPCEVPPVYCMRCESVLHSCSSCSTLSTITSQYCTQCGQKLMHKCCNCKELNSVRAIFCHYCGKKLEMNKEELQISYKDRCVMVEPPKMHASVQQTVMSVSKETQTPLFSKNRLKRPPSCSPGRGYWHQQLDYICNHLKSHAYNNVEFRDSISQHLLSDIQKAQVTKDDDIVSVTIFFSSLEKEKAEIKNLHKSSLA